MQRTFTHYKGGLRQLVLLLLFSVLPALAFSQSFTSITTTGLSMNKGSIHALIDYNNDGYEDLLFSNGTTTTALVRTLTLRKNNGDGTFTDVTTTAGLPTISSDFKALTFDYDRNGYKDILLLENGTTFRVFANAAGVFTETTTSLGINNPLLATGAFISGFTPADINKDGYLDILINRVTGSTRSISQLTNNAGSGFNTFSDLITGFASNINPYFQLIDYDNDQDDDLLVLNYQNSGMPGPGSPYHYYGMNLYKNTNGAFSASGISLPTASSFSFATIIDYNNDGYLDILSGSDDYASNKTLYTRVVKNNGNSTFTDVSSSVVLRSGNYYYFATSFADFDNDADFDVYRHVYGWNNTGSGNELYVSSNGSYSNQSAANNLNLLTYSPYEHVGGDPTWFDFDNDGDQDVFVSAVNYGNYDATSYFMRNNLTLTSAKYLDIKLAGFASTKEAIGARVVVYTNSKKLTQYKIINNTYFNNLSSDILHFGLAANTQADSVNVFWPSGKISRLYNVTANQKLTISEASIIATLSGLTLSSGTLSPVFASATTAYTASVANSAASITVTPTKTDGNATIQVQVNSGGYSTVTSGAASSALALNVGSNSINIKVTAQDGTTIKTYTVTVTRVMAPPGNALHFNRGNEYVVAPASSIINNLGLGSFTLEAWINPASVSGGSAYSIIRKTGDYNLFIINGKLYAEVWSGGSSTWKQIIGSTTITTGKWMHVAAVWNGSACSLYINGELNPSSMIGGNISGNTDLYIGNSMSTIETFSGKIDEVRIWNTAKTQAQLQAGMLNTVNASSPNLLVYYNFDNGTAGGANTGVTTLSDITGNGLNGTLTNFNLSGSTSNWVESYAMVVPTSTAATSISNAGFTANWTAPAVGTVTNYLLDVATNNTFTTLVSGYSAKNVGTSTSATVTGLSPQTTYYYRVRADKTSVTGTGAYSETITAATLNVTTATWTGAVSTDWNTAGNWNPASVPSASSKVTIPANATRFPVTSSGTITLTDLTIAAGATLNQTGSTLALTGSFANNGTFTSTGGTISFNGGSQQTISGEGSTTFNNLTIGSAGVSMSAPVSVKQLLTLTGNLITNSKVLKLLSDATGTAMVVNNPGTITGNITMQRYINPALNASTGYRHFSSPVQNATVADFATTGFTPVVNPAFNTAVNPASVKPYPNVQYYNQDRIVATNATTSDFNYGYMSPISLTDGLTPGKGYSVFMKASSKTDLVGTPNNGTITVNNLNYGGLANSGWQFLGNPYPSPIDWDQITVPFGMSSACYVYRSTGQYAGTWATYVNGIGAPGTDIIPAMQGFFVQVFRNVPAFTFTNAARLTSYNDPAMYRTAADARPVLQLSLNNDQQLADETYLYLEDGASQAFETDKDASKIITPELSLYTLAGPDALSVNGIGLAENQQVPLAISGNKGRLNLTVENLANFENYTVVLEDKLNKTFTPLVAGKTLRIAHSGGTDAQRFVLHLNAKNHNAAATKATANIYPNPTSAEKGFTLVMNRMATGKTTITVSNSIGQTLETRNVISLAGNLSETFNTSRLAKGIYTIAITSGQTKTVKKVVVQ